MALAGLGGFSLVSQAVKGVGLAADEEFRVDIESIESSYGVGEPIRFRVYGNRPFYLYLYNEDEESAGSIMILPNRKQRKNHYRAHRSYIVPSRTVEFVSDKPGRQRLVMIATEDDLSFDLDSHEASGDFSRTVADELDKWFVNKGVQIRRSAGGGVEGKTVVVREFDILIEDDGWARSLVETPVVFVSAASHRYVPGDRLTVLFGADRSGWVHLYAVEPGGSFDLLASRKVEADQVERLPVRIETPYGRHLLVAVYSTRPDINEDVVADIADDPRRAIDDPKEGYSIDVQTIRVSRDR
jgi:hypothetical protein